MSYDKKSVGAASENTTMSDQVLATRDTRFGGTNPNRSHRNGGVTRQVCPHCGATAVARTTRAITPLFRELRYQCTNIDGDDPCGHTFVASLVIERTIVPSARPNPKINLPLAAPRANRFALPSPSS